MADKISLDQRISQNIQKNVDQSTTKRGHSVDYLHEIATLNERQFEELWGSVQKLSKTLKRLESDTEVFYLFDLIIFFPFKGKIYFTCRINVTYSTI